MTAGASIFTEQLDALMGRVYRRAGGQSVAAGDEGEPLDELLAPEVCAPGADTAEERARMREEFASGARLLRRFYGYIFAKGPHPRHALPRLYTTANAIAPELLLNMSQGEIAAIFGQGRAAESARARALDAKLEKITRPGASFAGGKSTTSREKMRRAARGNKNRAGGRAPVANPGKGQIEKLPPQPVPHKAISSAA